MVEDGIEASCMSCEQEKDASQQWQDNSTLTPCTGLGRSMAAPGLVLTKILFFD